MKNCCILGLLCLVTLLSPCDAVTFRRHADAATRLEVRRPTRLDNRNVNQKQQRETKNNSLDLRGGDDTKGGGASMTAMVFNLVNNVAGAGILSLSAGQAKGTGYIPSVIISILLGMISARSFCMVGEACDMLGEGDFKGLWAKTMGEKTTWVVDSLIAVLCLAVSVIYSGVIGDVFTPLLEQAGFPAKYNGRGSNILAITIALLFPMSLIKNLSALAFTSILGFCAIMYTVFFINFRALDGSYKLGAGKFVTDGVLKVLPSFQKSSLWNINFSSLVLISNLGLAYVAHYNAPGMYRELKDTSAKRFGTMVNIAFVILIFLYIITMLAGYSTFGDTTMGNILLNYHKNDILATLGQLATGFSILFGFPLVAAGARESLIGALSGLGFPQFGDPKNHVKFVMAMLTFVTVISINATDISLVMGLTGAALGSFICYVCPGLLYVKAVEIAKGKDSSEYKAMILSKALAPFGVLIGALGVFITIRSAS